LITIKNKREPCESAKTQLLQTMTWITSLGPSSKICPGPPYPSIRLWIHRQLVISACRYIGRALYKTSSTFKMLFDMEQMLKFMYMVAQYI